MVTTYSRKGRGRSKKTIASRTRSTRKITTLPGLIKGSYSLRLPGSSKNSVASTPAASGSGTGSARGRGGAGAGANGSRTAVTVSGSPSSVDEVNSLLLANTDSDKHTRTSTRTKARSYGKQYLKSGLWASSTPSSIPFLNPNRPGSKAETSGDVSDAESEAIEDDERGKKGKDTGKGKERQKESKGKEREMGLKISTETAGSGSGSSLRSKKIESLFTTTQLNHSHSPNEAGEQTVTIPPTPGSQPSTATLSSIPTASEHSPKTASSRASSSDSEQDSDTTDSSDEDMEVQDVFPPLPMYWGRSLVNDERDFVLPWDLVKDVEEGVLDRKRTPGKYKQIKHNIFVERKPYTEDAKVICNCAPSSGCKDGCLNRAMHYICGKGCPAGTSCTNGSLYLRSQKKTKVVFTGSRGFGLNILEKVDEGEFIMDYRGEIIGLETYFNRIRTIYAGRKDFYALDYDMDEVIDAGQKGNDSRFINHSCSPNIEVRKYQTAGAGLEEYEIGFWALRDIAPGEELCYNYNFDSFTTYKRPIDPSGSLLTAVTAEGRQRCFCGASNCSGWLGKRSSSAGESSNQASGSKLPPAPIVPPKKKLGRPKGVPNKVTKLKVVKSDAVTPTPEPSKRVSARLDTAEPVTPIPKRRKLDDVIIPSQSAIKKLVKARELAMAAAKECGISLERSNGRKRSIAQLGETARLARTICDELTSLQAAVASSSRTVEGSARMRAGPSNASSSRVRTFADVAPDGISTGSESEAEGGNNAGDADEDEKEIDEEMPVGSEPQSWRVVSVRQTSYVPASKRSSVRAGKARAVEVEEQWPEDEIGNESAWMSASESEREGVSRKGSRSSKRARRSISEQVLDEPDIQDPPIASSSVNLTEPPHPISGEYLVSMREPEPEQREPVLQFDEPIASGSVAESSSKASSSKGDQKTKQSRREARSRRAAQKPHAILTPDRMIKSRLALLNGEQLEAERRSRRQGPEWVTAQITALRGMHRAIALGAVPPPPGYVRPDRNLDEYYSYRPVEAKFPTDTTVFSLILDVPLAAHPIEMWKRSVPTFPLCEQDDDDEKTLVDPSDFEIYQKGVFDLFGYVKNIKIHESEPVQDSEAPPVDKSTQQGTGHDQPSEGGNGEGDQAGGGADESANLPRGGEGSGNAGGDDGDDGKRGPPADEGEPEAQEEVVEEDEEARKKREAEAVAAEQEQGVISQEGLTEQAVPPAAPDAIEPPADHRAPNEPDHQWFEAMQGIVAAQRAQAGQEVPDEIGPAELAAAQIEIYAQQAVATPRSSPDRDMTPPYDPYDNGHYGSPSSQYGPDDYDGHDDDSFQRYIITHGLTVDEIEWSSVSDMTDLEEMEMNEREIVSTAPDMEKYNRSRRSRKPRPPRRFKTIITRIRPKLEAAITDVTPAEEDAALERERKRRKKGQAWLNSMKALAQARREAKARQEAGLPPPEFTLPPTSLTPSGQKKRVKKESDKTEAEDESADPGPSGSVSVDVDNQALAQVKRKKSTNGKSRARKPSPPVAPLPAYDYHDGHENQQYLEALGQENYDALLSNQAGGSDNGVAALPDDPNVAPDYSALLHAANESAVVDGNGEHHHGVDQYYQQDYDVDESNPVSTLVQAANMFSNGQADAYMQNANFDYSSLHSHNPYASINFAQFGQAGEGSSTGGQLPPVPPLGRTLPGSTYSTPSPGRAAVSLTTTRTGEKRRRGPPVKKIAGAMLMPLTDEQWEAERKKRKKGFGWVQETKAAAEAERLARAQRAAGLPVEAPPKKARSSTSGKMVEQQDMFGHTDDLYHTLEGHAHHETLADAHGQGQGMLHDGQDDIVPFPSTADDDFALGTGLYETQEQDMSHYADHAQNGNHYGDVTMS